MYRAIGLLSVGLGLCVALVGGLSALQIAQHLPLLCPDDPACTGARGAVWVGISAVVVGVIMIGAGIVIRRRAGGA